MSSENTTPDNTEYAIEVNGLGKCYQIYDKPSDRLKQMLMRGRKQYYKEFWALKDVSFKIKKGETVGIIGRNGSGKSTLLQMICGTLNPTEGEVKVNGRVAALLELGAGFNPEFSGVENVYMAASLYGLSKEEVDQRFDAIATFADIGDHIHQPVKTYSSGMYVRLAFAVIAHVDADILIIDEALAVGDAIFTQKCMRFLRKFKEEKTLLFVSHDSSSVIALCNKAIWLAYGEIRELGEAKKICENYLTFVLGATRKQDQSAQYYAEPKAEELRQVWANKLYYEVAAASLFKSNLLASLQMGPLGAEIKHVTVTAEDCSDFRTLKGGEIVTLSIHAVAHQSLQSPVMGFFVKDRLGQFLFGSNTLNIKCRKPLHASPGNELMANFTFAMPWLAEGAYSIQVAIADGDQHEHTQHHWIHDAVIFHSTNDSSATGLIGIPMLDIRLIVND